VMGGDFDESRCMVLLIGMYLTIAQARLIQ
jgi:hypothetical protein